MNVSNFLTKNIQPLDPSVNIGEAIDLMKKWKITHIPIVKKKELIGNLCYEYIKNLKGKELEQKIREEDLESFFLLQNASIFDTLSVFNKFESNLLPIISVNGKYLGVVLVNEIIDQMSLFPFIAEPGMVLTVETHLKNYSLTEITQIVESNSAKVLGALITSIKDEQIQVTLKIYSENIVSIQETFERFGYIIVNKSFADSREDFFKDRYRQLKSFMEL